MQFEHTGFFDLIGDALFHYRQAVASRDASDQHSGYRANRHARMSVIASVFAVECAANCLVDALEANRQLKEEIDKLNILGKFDIAATIGGSGSVNRSDARCGKITELVQARNAFVHPRKKHTKLDIEGVEETSTDHLVGISIAGDVYRMLGIPKWPVFWNDESAATALAATCDFLSWYFCELLLWTPERVYELLASRIVVGEAAMTAVFEEIYDEIRAASKAFDFSYVYVPEALEQPRRDSLYRKVTKSSP